MLSSTGNALQAGSLAEQRLVDHLKDALRVMVEWSAPSFSQQRKESSVRFALRSLCRHLERLMAFEESGGYLTGVTDARPHWQSRVGKLRDEHERLRERLRTLTPRLDDRQSWEGDEFELSCSAIRELLDEVERHDRNEVALLQDTMLWDEGSGG